MRRIRKPILGATVLALLLLLSACQTGGERRTGSDEELPTITVGVSSAFPENQIVAEMYAQVLEAAGYTVERQMSIDSREVSQPALENGEIDVKPEYLATLLLYYNKDATNITDADEVAEQLDPLLEAKGVELLQHSEAVDTNAIVVTKATADEHQLAKVSDLQPVAGTLVFGGPPECPERPFCIPGLKETYGLEFKEFKPLDVGGNLTVAALEGGEIDVALLFSTSGVIAKKGFVLLEDDKNLQAADNIAPVVNAEVVTDQLRELLNEVSAALTTANITELNARVEVDNEDPAEVAKDFLEQEDLV
ncbi:MAG: ABC transporter substrate-binding protein [Actinobacteria bacterium]|nr:ABC transporter substrate-binding protein [Actinomycetota bacterium]